MQTLIQEQRAVGDRDVAPLQPHDQHRGAAWAAGPADGEVIIAPKHSAGRYWGELWAYRELLYFLTWRDVLVRYKQTVAGLAWAVIPPLLRMLVLTLVFGRLAKMPSNGVPYPVLVFSALLPWQLFADAFSKSSRSLVGNTNLISKVYFPRMLIPISSLLSSLVDFLIAGLILFVLMLCYGVLPGWQVVFLPGFILLGLLAAFGVGLFLAAVNVRYRDVAHIVPFVVQFGLFISPVGFSSAVVPDQWRLLYSLNPMVGVIDGVRWSLVGGRATLYWPGLGASLIVVLSALVVGAYCFRRTERTFADLI